MFGMINEGENVSILTAYGIISGCVLTKTITYITLGDARIKRGDKAPITFPSLTIQLSQVIGFSHT